jgi:hypothetical protein
MAVPIFFRTSSTTIFGRRKSSALLHSIPNDVTVDRICRRHTLSDHGSVNGIKTKQRFCSISIYLSPNRGFRNLLAYSIFLSSTIEALPNTRSVSVARSVPRVSPSDTHARIEKLNLTPLYSPINLSSSSTQTSSVFSIVSTKSGNSWRMAPRIFIETALGFLLLSKRQFTTFPLLANACISDVNCLRCSFTRT